MLSVCQFLYHAWITDSRTAMKARNNHKKLWKKNSSDRGSRREEGREGEEEGVVPCSDDGPNLCQDRTVCSGLCVLVVIYIYVHVYIYTHIYMLLLGFE